MVDECGNLLRGPPSIYGPYQKYCFNAAFATDGNDTFTPCVRSAQGLRKQFGAQGGGVASLLHVDFTPAVEAVGQASQPASAKLRCRTPLVTTSVDGKQRHMCAVPVAQNISKNCVSTMKRVWQCDRFLARGDLDGYNKCKAMQDCFQYDIKMPDGTVLPLAVDATETCLVAADMALKQAAPNCVNGMRGTCTSQPSW